MFKGPSGPVSGRTRRTQAEDIGTNPEGFKDGPPYDYTAGHPITRQQPSQQYEDKSASVTPKPGKGPLDIPAPFATK